MRRGKRECEKRREIEKYLYMSVRISDIMYDSKRKRKREREKERKKE